MRERQRFTFAQETTLVRNLQCRQDDFARLARDSAQAFSRKEDETIPLKGHRLHTCAALEHMDEDEFLGHFGTLDPIRADHGEADNIGVLKQYLGGFIEAAIDDAPSIAHAKGRRSQRHAYKHQHLSGQPANDDPFHNQNAKLADGASSMRMMRLLFAIYVVEA